VSEDGGGFEVPLAVLLRIDCILSDTGKGVENDRLHIRRTEEYFK
jgi:hypothetical protein